MNSIIFQDENEYMSFRVTLINDDPDLNVNTTSIMEALLKVRRDLTMFTKVDIQIKSKEIEQ